MAEFWLCNIITLASQDIDWKRLCNAVEHVFFSIGDGHMFWA
jgi:hypothetical protein